MSDKPWAERIICSDNEHFFSETLGGDELPLPGSVCQCRRIMVMEKGLAAIPDGRCLRCKQARDDHADLEACPARPRKVTA